MSGGKKYALVHGKLAFHFERIHIEYQITQMRLTRAPRGWKSWKMFDGFSGAKNPVVDCYDLVHANISCLPLIGLNQRRETIRWCECKWVIWFIWTDTRLWSPKHATHVLRHPSFQFHVVLWSSPVLGNLLNAIAWTMIAVAIISHTPIAHFRYSSRPFVEYNTSTINLKLCVTLSLRSVAPQTNKYICCLCVVLNYVVRCPTSLLNECL